MNCAYQLADGTCGSPIVVDGGSYSGFTHEHKADWMHWASPVSYSRGLQETERIFKPCAVCGKQGPDNDEHMLYSGHHFRTE